MRPINDYIRTLLFEHDYVTVPNFGSFILNYMPSSTNDISGSLMPPQKRIAFNEILKQDDGLLATYISRRESLTIDEAKRKIQGFVLAIKESLTNQKTYSFDKVGVFALNDENNLVFEPDKKNNFYSESYGFDNIFPRHITKERYVYSTTFEDNEDELLIHKNAYSSTIVRKSKGWTYALYSLPILLLSSGLCIVLFADTKNTEAAKSSFNPLDYIPKEEITIEKPQLQNDAKAAEYKQVLKIPEANKVATKNKNLESNVTEPSKELTKREDTPAIIFPPKATNPVDSNSESTINKDTKRYLIVSGMFKNALNVEKLQILLEKNGFSPKIITIGELTKVVAAETNSYAEAVALSEKHIKLIGEKPAIMKAD